MFERRGHVTSWAILVSYYLLLPFAIGGLVVMRRRRIPIFPMIAVAVSVTLTSVLGYPITRYRAAFDAVTPVLAAVAIGALWTWWRGRQVAPAGARAASVGESSERTPVGVAE